MAQCKQGKTSPKGVCSHGIVPSTYQPTYRVRVSSHAVYEIGEGGGGLLCLGCVDIKYSEDRTRERASSVARDSQ